MKRLPRCPIIISLLLAPALFFGSALQSNAAVLINEIMFHPAGTPEPTAQEWIELANTGTTSVSVAGWRFTDGVEFTFPAGTSIPAGGYLVVTADVTAFNTSHPGYAGQLLGGWTGRLSNSGEHLLLEDPAGTKVDELTYADEGDWALRARGPLLLNHRGWIWVLTADGGGKSLELRNSSLGNGNGQNWGPSVPDGGTPGAVNSIASGNVAPLIKDAKHRPEIPRATDPLRISCQLEDELPGAVATLRWRLDGAATFQALPMTDTDGDGNVEATIPAPLTNLAIAEWYISATDGVNTRTWPAPARTSDIGITPETFGQVTNALVQFDNGYVAATDFTAAGNQPIYRIIMTNAERAELAQIGSVSAQADSDAEMNATFISFDGTGIKTRYRCGVRNRGNQTRLGPPNNYHVSFPSESRWNGRSAIQINWHFPHSQALGAALYTRAGVAPQECSVVQVRVNGSNLAEAGTRMFGRYARLEPLGPEWTERHFPDDPDGNIYRLDDHAPNPVGTPPGDLGSGEFRYEGTNPDAYRDTYLKQTNSDDDDFSDLFNLTRIVSAPITGGSAAQPAIPNDQYVNAVSAVLDLDNFYTFIAADALIGNQEGGFQTGRADDASIYRGVVDPRVKFIPHDLDDVFDIGEEAGNPVTRSIFAYDTNGGGLQGLTRLFNHPQLVPRYYAKVLECLDSWFNSTTVDPIIDQIMTGTVAPSDATPTPPNNSIAEIKAFVTARRANVLSQIQQNYTLNVTTTGTNTPEGYRVTPDGAATFSGTFNVARTYSITVNGVPATLSYRGATPGTWSLAVPAGGGAVLHPGLNNVVVNFWSAPAGTGNILQSLTADVVSTPTATGTTINGALAVGSMRLIAPSSYIPGVPFLVRADLLNGQGQLDRTAWNTTVTLSSSVQGITLPSITLNNGMGSALVTVGGSGGGGTSILIQPGGTAAAPNASSTPWRILDTGAEPVSTWKSDAAFDDTTWTSGNLQAGAGDADERTVLNNVPGSAANTRRAFYFRKTFNVADPSTFVSMQIRAVIDDGAVFYLNGSQILADGMPAAPYTITTPASANRSGTQETQIRTFDVSAFLPLLQAGTNLLAVEVHNFSDNLPTYSADLSFDCELNATAPSTDPGSFTVTASGGGFTAQKSLTSLGAPTMTNVSGALPTGTTTWSGVIHVTGDVTIPATGVLNISPGTHVIVDGTPFVAGTAAVDPNGADLIVNGQLSALGTLANPISITCSDRTNRWGRIAFATGSQPSTLRSCLLSLSGHSPQAGGHIPNSGGQMMLLSGNTLTIEDSVLADGVGKTMTNSGNANLTIRNSQLARFTMGPELDGSTVTIEDSNLSDMLPIYRERGAADDEDCIYIHDSDGRPVNLLRSVFSNAGDDGVDCLAGSLSITDCIIRNILDKGVSLLQNDITIRGTQIVDCDFGISAKTQIGDESSPYTTTLENCTIVGEVHPTNQSDQSGGIFWHSVGIHVRNKYGTGPNAQLIIAAKNCIISAVTPMLNDYAVAGNDFPLTTVTYDCFHDVTGTNPIDPAPPTGTGVISTDPLFVSAAAKDFHLSPTSPCRDTGDPASPTNADGSRADMGALPFAIPSTAGSVTWTPSGSPYRIVSNLTVPVGTTLTIQAGTAVQFAQGTTMTVNGTLKVLGSAGAHVVFSHPPGVVATGDADPIAPGTQTGPPKWEGVRIVGPGSPQPMSTGHEIRYADFINAQPAVSAGNQGSLGIIRAEADVDHCTWRGTHLRMLYGRNCSLTVTNCIFPDMFNPLDDTENPTSSSYNLDNIAEPMKVEHPVGDPTSNPQLVSNPNYVIGLPVGGHWRAYYNHFNGNKGHNDVFDADSGRWGQTQILDCRYNYFHGLTGDEHIDLGGDAYVASNIFERCAKDQWTNDRGYANCISSGDKGSGTTIWVVRNLAFDVDHVINCKVSTGTVFEHNTVANLHPDFTYNSTPPVAPFSQAVKCSAVNLYVPEDSAPQAGDGAYVAYNLFHSIPRVISWADLPQTPTQTVSKLEAANNYLNGITDNSVGPDTATYHGGTQHPGGFTSLGSFVAPGDPLFVNASAKNFSLQQGSPARGTAAGGLDYGASVAEWAYILGGPSAQTTATTATFTIGGPGIVAYKWRLDGGVWSAPIQIGSGGVFPRTGPTVRTASLNLSNLTTGSHMLEVLGQDPAGNWQDADPAKAVQVPPTSRTWLVNPALVLVRINEIRADSVTSQPDAIELYNGGSDALLLDGWSLSDTPTLPFKYQFAAGTVIPAGGYLVVTAAQTTINIDNDGDAIYLYQAGTLKDSVTFGHQLPDLSIGRIGVAGEWALCTPTFGGPNLPGRTGDLSTIRINEWFSDGDVLYDNDWIELANTGALPVDLAGMKLADNRAGSPHMHTMAPLSFIAANGYLKLIADGDPEFSPTHLDFSLDAEQESIALYNPAGALLDTVAFYAQTTDYSMYRDGSSPGGYGFRELPTGGFEISTSDPLYLNALAILRGLRITEIMYNAIGGNDYEYVELRNVGAVAFDLGGVKFVEGIDYIFPSMALGPGQSIVVVKNLSNFRARYGNTPVVAGVYSGNLDNSGEDLALQLPPPFDANVLTFHFADTWYSITDGFGSALYVGNPLLRASLWGDRETWLASELGGSPGGILARSDNYTGWSALHGAVTVTDDGDRDGVAAIVEFGLGMNPENPNGTNGRAGLPVVIRGPLGRVALNFLVPQNAAAAQGHGMLEAVYTVLASDDLITWSPLATKSYSGTWTGPGSVTLGSGSGGYIPVTVEDNQPAGSQQRRYLRLQLGWVP